MKDNCDSISLLCSLVAILILGDLKRGVNDVDDFNCDRGTCKEHETLLCLEKQIKYTQFRYGKIVSSPTCINSVNLRTRYGYKLFTTRAKTIFKIQLSTTSFSSTFL